MESSRIFIHGLPSNLSVNEFRKHFSKISAVTDAKYIPHRRIGYVGYKTYDDAQKAVKYYNKSFIHMSRIGVELARPVRGPSYLRDTSWLTAGVRSKSRLPTSQERVPLLLFGMAISRRSVSKKICRDQLQIPNCRNF